MIKLISIDGGTTDEKVCTVFADTKAEVPETGSATEVKGLVGTLSAGSIVYTAKLEVALLKSDDTWEWGE